MPPRTRVSTMTTVSISSDPGPPVPVRSSCTPCFGSSAQCFSLTA
jgi:hypothetical protein